MEHVDLIRSGIGAVLGFLLAQFVSLAKLFWDWRNRPRLMIEPVGTNCVILSHTTEVGTGEQYNEKIYGFYVRNMGRRIAAGVRVQLIKIEFRGRNWPEFTDASEHAYDLSLYIGAGRISEDRETVLVPRAKVIVELAKWREDYDVIFPTVSGLPDYYEEICSGSVQFRFTVVAFDEEASFARKVLTIDHGKRRSAIAQKS